MKPVLRHIDQAQCHQHPKAKMKDNHDNNGAPAERYQRNDGIVIGQRHTLLRISLNFTGSRYGCVRHSSATG